MDKRNLLVASAILLSLTGCSAQMALHGNSTFKEPNFSLMTKGQSKSIVESQPIIPIKTEQLENGNILSTYEFTVGAPPSMGRAAVYLALDLGTMFLSEIVTYPYEMHMGVKKQFKVEYTTEGEVIKIL